MFLKVSLSIALCACLVLVDACTTRRQQRWVEPVFAYEISPQPPRVGPVTLNLRLTHFSGAGVTGVNLTVEGNMSHAGMVPVFADAKEIEPGHYQSVLKLTMAGDWFVIVHATLPDKRKATYEFEIKGVEP